MTPRNAAPAVRRLAPLFLALALAGCASTHGIAPVGAPADADALAASATLGRAGHAAALSRDWWRAFGDPQLHALVEEALAGQPALAAADARVRQAVAQAGLADAARQPTVGATAQYSGVLIPESVAPPPLGGEYKGVILLGLNIKYAPDLWGGDRARYEATIGQLRAAEVDAQAARVSLAANVVRAYIGLAQAYDALDVASAEATRSKGLLSLARQRARAGVDNQLPVRNAEALIASAGQQATAAQQQVDTTRNAIAALLGKGPDRGATIARPRLLKAPSPGVPSVVPSELLGHRPDVVAARWRAEAANRGISAAKAQFYPTVNLSALVGLAAGGLGDLLSTNALVAQGGPALSLPIFDGGRLRNNLEKSTADYDLAVAAYNGSLVTGLREVADALAIARRLDAQIAQVREARDAAKAALSLANTRYKAGLSTQIDVLNAQRPLLQLDQQLAALRAQRLVAVVDLDQALGGGLELALPTSDSLSDSTADAR
ncbi:efflux transporter outer membrane subunit [Lysobacter xanthus]